MINITANQINIISDFKLDMALLIGINGPDDPGRSGPLDRKNWLHQFGKYFLVQESPFLRAIWLFAIFFL